MKILTLSCLWLGMLTSPAWAALPEGALAPNFEAPASLAGKAFNYSLQDHLRKGPVVVYFYPSAFTNGCNLQAHSFATQYEKFTAAGASIIGVSLDSIARLNAFSADADYCAGKIAVASDVGGKIAQAYAIDVRATPTGRQDTRGQDIDHGLAERTSFVLAADGRIVATIGGLNPVANVEKALEAVQKLAAASH